MAKKETLFQLLSAQPWWVTLIVAFALYWLAKTIFPPVAPFIALPFIVLAIYIGYTQWRTGSPSDAGERLVALREMSWEAFSAAVTEAYRKQHYEVSPSDGRGYDFELTRGGRVTLLQCRQWKVNQVGVAPVRELAQAIERKEASRGICLAAGDFSVPARKAASSEPITLVSGLDLAELVGRAGQKKRAWFSRK
jgi:restriction system protein